MLRSVGDNVIRYMERSLIMAETEYRDMNKDEMQRFVDQQMRDGKSWPEALERLAEIVGIKPCYVE